MYAKEVSPVFLGFSPKTIPSYPPLCFSFFFFRITNKMRSIKQTHGFSLSPYLRQHYSPSVFVLPRISTSLFMCSRSI